MTPNTTASRPDLGTLERTNDWPEPAQEGPLHTITSTLREELEKIAGVVKELGELQAGLAAQVATWKKAQANKELEYLAYRRFLHPLRRLPIEILTLIFVEACTSPTPNALTLPEDYFETPNTVWALSSTCRKWREIVLVTPTLWSDIRVDFDGIQFDGDEDDKQVLKTVTKQLSHQISSARAAPLSVSFGASPPTGFGYEDTLPAPLHYLFAPSAPKITRLILELPLEALAEFSMISSSLCTLDTLVLAVPPHLASGGLLEYSLDWVGDCKLLTDFHVVNFPDPDYIEDFPSSITQYTVQHYSVASDEDREEAEGHPMYTVAHMLPHVNFAAAGLHSLSISLTGTAGSIPNDIVEFPSLRALSISARWAKHVGEFLEHIQPESYELKDVSIEVFHRGPQHDGGNRLVKSVSSWGERHRFKWQTLNLRDVDPDWVDEDWRNLFVVVFSLSHFSYRGNLPAEKLLRWVANDDDELQGLPMPLLESFTLEGPHFQTPAPSMTDALEQFSDVISQYYADPRAPLRQVNLRWRKAAADVQGDVGRELDDAEKKRAFDEFGGRLAHLPRLEVGLSVDG